MPGQAIRSVEIYEGAERMDRSPGALLLWVGTGTPDELGRALGDCVGPGPAGLVLRGPFAPDVRVREQARELGTALLELAPDHSWIGLADAVRALSTRYRLGPRDAVLRGQAVGDLFAVTDAISSLFGAPVTLEDRTARVLAWSAGQDEADQARITGILQRRAPRSVVHNLTARGIFRRLDASVGPIVIPATESDSLPRLAVAVRAGGEVLGYLWIAVRAPVPDGRIAELGEIAKTVAVHVLHDRARRDGERRLRADLAATVLRGDLGSGEAARALGLASDAVCVVAVQTPGAEAEAANGDDGFAVAMDAFDLHLTATLPRSVTVGLGAVGYALLPWPRTLDDDGVRARAFRLAADFTDRMAARIDVIAGIGSVARGPGDVPRARAEADRALRVAREYPGFGGGVATADAVRLPILLLGLADAARELPDAGTGAVAALFALDAAEGTEFVPTLRAYLNTFGDVSACAERLHVHPNTFRRRLKRIAEVGGIDLGDPDARLLAELGLRLHDLRRPD